MSTRRLFFALWLDEPAARAAHQVALAIAAQSGGRAMRQESLHLTLAFLGATPRAQSRDLIPLAAELATESTAFTLVLDQLGHWPRNHIVWASSRQPAEALNRLADQLTTRLREHGFATDERPFHPHVTLLRNVSAMDPTPIAAEPIVSSVNEFRLVESIPLDAGGFRHETVARWPLG